jgi:hypothetical protein
MSHRVTGISDKIPKHLQELFELQAALADGTALV